jgi:hypothetical protein
LDRSNFVSCFNVQNLSILMVAFVYHKQLILSDRIGEQCLWPFLLRLKSSRVLLNVSRSTDNQASPSASRQLLLNFFPWSSLPLCDIFPNLLFVSSSVSLFGVFLSLSSCKPS